MGVEGNENTDEAAKTTAETSDTRRCPEQFTSLAYIRSTITEWKWKEDKYWF